MTKPAVGSAWRILAYSPDGVARFDLRSPGMPETQSSLDSVAAPASVLDEVVIDSWFHLEQMGDRDWWMNIGGVVVNVSLRKDGTPKLVRVEVEDPQPGCEYL